MPRALESESRSPAGRVLFINPDTPVNSPSSPIPKTDPTYTAGEFENSFGHMMGPCRTTLQANQVFTPLELLKRLAAIRRRIRKEGGVIGDERRVMEASRAVKMTCEERRAGQRRNHDRSHYAARGMTLVSCCVCRRTLVGKDSPACEPGGERAARKDAQGLSYCRRCEGVTVRIVTGGNH